MSYITRDDGAHFVIPSYRDVLAGKNKGQLKKDILLLSQSYGEYITLRPKGRGGLQYEVAFSADQGYLLGETVWDHFKRPEDMIYCEVIPNTSEAILVIVKSGSVYLDGSFPTDSIPEELVIFLTQQNHFEIYVYGDVPIGQTPESGKFSFEASAVASFTVLDKPVFPTLPLLKVYQLQLVEPALTAQGIGGAPIRQIVIGIVILFAGYFVWTMFPSAPPPPPPQVEINPYEGYLSALSSPAPDQEIQNLIYQLSLLFNMPGWSPGSVNYVRDSVDASVTSNGSTVDVLMSWAKLNNATINIVQNGFHVQMSVKNTNRPALMQIYDLKEVIARLIDKIGSVYPGNNFQMAQIEKRGMYSDVKISITFQAITPAVLSMIGQQLKDLPLVLQSVTLTVTNGTLSGTIIIQALGK